MVLSNLSPVTFRKHHDNGWFYEYYECYKLSFLRIIPVFFKPYNSKKRTIPVFSSKYFTIKKGDLLLINTKVIVGSKFSLSTELIFVCMQVLKHNTDYKIVQILNKFFWC